MQFRGESLPLGLLRGDLAGLDFQLPGDLHCTLSALSVRSESLSPF